MENASPNTRKHPQLPLKGQDAAVFAASRGSSSSSGCLTASPACQQAEPVKEEAATFTADYGPDIARAMLALQELFPGFTTGMLRYYALDTRITSDDGTLREGTAEELAAEYAEVSKYVVREKPVPVFVDDGFLSEDWQPSDGVGPFEKNPMAVEVATTAEPAGAWTFGQEGDDLRP